MERRENKKRVKVYLLDSAAQWEDKGTGHVSCQYLEKYKGLCLVVRSEKEEGSILLESKVVANDVYQLQQDTLIVWNDPETDADLALSFQEPQGCKEIWDQLVAFQRLNNPEGHDDNAPEPSTNNSVDDEEIEHVGSDLPPATLANLGKILQAITSANSAFKREKLVLQMQREQYLKKLVDLFSICEDLEDEDNLRLMFQIFKALILLNDSGLYEVMFTDDMMLHVMGALEYDPELPKRVRHRDYLKSQAVFKQVVPFENKELVAKIHQTFRIQYLKDVALPRSLDDPTFGTLNSMIFFNHVEIVSCVQSDDKFLKQLFNLARDPGTPPAKLRDAMCFLQELCNLAKTLQIQSRAAFYQTMSRYELLDVVGKTLSHEDVRTRLATVNIVDSVVNHDPTLLRQFILSQKPNCAFLSSLVDAFLWDPEMGIRVQLVEVLRILIDTATLEETPEKDDFLSVFYADHIQKLIEPLSEKPTKEVADSVKESICDILAFCVTHHSFRIKYFLLGNNVTSRVLSLLHSRQRHLVLGAIRFLRAFVGMKDDFYNRHLTKKNLFDPIIEVFKENGPKYNLLNSAIIELFEFIRKENIRHLVQHVVEHYGEFFKTVDYVETFKLLVLKYDQNLENPTDSASSTPTLSANSLNGSRGGEDEDYFNTDDEEEATAQTASGSPEKGEPDRQFKPMVKKDHSDDIPPIPALKKEGAPKENGKKKISINISNVTHTREESEEEGSIAKKRKT